MAHAQADRKEVAKIRTMIRMLEDEAADMVYGPGPLRMEEARRSELYRQAGQPSHFGRPHRLGARPEGTALSDAERRTVILSALGVFRWSGMSRVTEPGPAAMLRIGRSGSLLAVGEPLILSGSPGVGKSTLALQLAAAAGSCERWGARWRQTAGVSIRTGIPVAIASWEESGPRIRQRWRQVRLRTAPGVRSCEMGGRTLYGTAGQDGTGTMPTRHWQPFWRSVSAALDEGRRALDVPADRPGIVVLDPALAAFAADDKLASVVREFMGAANVAAAESNAALLIVHHPTKIRGSILGREEQTTSGSVQWMGAARGALYMRRDADGSVVLTVTKANYHPPAEIVLTRRNNRTFSVRRDVL